AGIGVVHLVGFFIARFRGGIERASEGSVKSGSVFGRVAEDRNIGKTCRIERATQSGDAAVHHVARRNDVRSGGGVAESLLAENFDRFVIENAQRAIGLFFHETIVTIGIVGIEGDIGDHAKFRASTFDGANDPWDQAIRIEAFGGVRGFQRVVDFGKKHNGGDPSGKNRTSFRDDVGFAPAGDTGHRGNGIIGRSLLQKERLNKIVSAESRFAHQRADGCCSAVAAWSDGKVHDGDFVREAGEMPALQGFEFVAVFAVFDRPTEVGELIAEDIRLRPVLRLADGEALLGESANFLWNGDCFFLREHWQSEAEGAEDAVKAGERLSGGETFLFRSLTESGENGTKSSCCIKIVIECIPRGLEGTKLNAGEHRIRGSFSSELLSGFCHFIQSLTCGVEAIKGEIERFAVVTAEEDVAHFHRRPTVLREVGEGVKIAERLRHFSAIDHQMRDVEPSGGEMPAAGASALSDFIFVMGKDQIDAAAVEVERFAEVLADHCRALQVPTGSAITPGRGPEIFAILGSAGFP
ncbi:MAG: hypothetical protein RLZZ224_797, partial [Verrucomicrobiota bacterium]